jgi:ribosomal-protein-alanine N-acetyltransferase
VNIRGARQDEAEELAEIGLRAWDKAMVPVGETRQMLDNARRAFQYFTRNSWITITVIELGGVTAGWAAREALDENITDFWIDPPHQRQGLGARLLTAMEDEIERQGFLQASLETHARNEQAVAFFQKHGYSVRWFSVSYNPKLDRDVETIGLSKQLIELVTAEYGHEF